MPTGIAARRSPIGVMARRTTAASAGMPGMAAFIGSLRAERLRPGVRVERPRHEALHFPESGVLGGGPEHDGDDAVLVGILGRGAETITGLLDEPRLAAEKAVRRGVEETAEEQVGRPHDVRQAGLRRETVFAL